MSSHKTQALASNILRTSSGQLRCRKDSLCAVISWWAVLGSGAGVS